MKGKREITKVSKTPEDSKNVEKKEDSTFNLDGILAELGSFGKYQLLLLLLLAFRDGFLSMCNFHYVFTAAEDNFRCIIPECDSSAPHFNASWLHGQISNLTNICVRHPLSSSANISFMHNETLDSWHGNLGNSCTSDLFDHRKTIPCQDVVYENNNSIVAEFNLGCEQWKRTLIGTIHNAGLVFSFIVSGLISDRYGRKVIIVMTPLVVGLCGVLKSFSINLWMLLVLEFLETAFGYGNASLVLTLEIVSQNSRVVFSSISDILSNIGGSFFGLIAWKIPYWRYTMRAIYAPLLVVVFYIFLVDEGVRWLLAHNKKIEAVKILNKVAKVNNVTLSNTAKNMMDKMTEEVERTDKHTEETKTEPSHLRKVLKSKKILIRLAITASCFFFSIFIYYGALINSASISGNKYFNYSLMVLVSVPVRILSAYTLTKFGRKAPICVANGLCAVFFVMSAFISKTVWWTPILMYVLGKMCASFALFALTVFSMEVFPTTSRNTLTNIAATFGRIGGVLAPQAPLLEHYMPGLPSIVFGLAALMPAILVLFLPDPSKLRLPDDVQDAEAMDHQQNQDPKDTV